MHNIVIYTVSHKQETSNLRQQLHQTLTNFRHFFTDRFLENFATKWLLKIPPHLIRVASLPCKRRLYENKTPRNTNTNCPPLHTRKTYTRATHRGGRYNFHWKKQCIKFSKISTVCLLRMCDWRQKHSPRCKITSTMILWVTTNVSERQTKHLKINKKF